MEIERLTGKFIVAVSGGVDSMALLHKLHADGGDVIVAHFDHGIRPGSQEDREFVEKLAASYGLPFVFERVELGEGASEALARDARYAFLKRVKNNYGADAIITAHHQDDVLETAILNLSRGTGRRGLTSLASTNDLKRPLLNITKLQLLAYAKEHKLAWREDSTNLDQKYLRNYIRHTVVPRFSSQERQQFLQYINNLREVNLELDKNLLEQLDERSEDNRLTKSALTSLPDEIAKEILITWWRKNGFTSYESKTLKRALTDCRNGKTGAIIPLKHGYYITVGRAELALNKSER